MWIDIQAGPAVMAVAWSLITLIATCVVYGFARVAEYAAMHMGEARATPGEVWGLSDCVMGIVVALIALAVAIAFGSQAAYWFTQAWPWMVP